MVDKALKKVGKMPYIESKVFKSKNGALLVHRTTITDVKPINYYKKVVETMQDEDELELQEIAV